MAAQRSTVADLITEIRRIMGEPNAARSHITDANILKVMNRYLQHLSVRAAGMLKSEGLSVKDSTLHLDMWRESWTSGVGGAEDKLVVASGSSTVNLPSNYDHFISFYDLTHKRHIPVVSLLDTENTKIEELLKKSAGPIEAIEIFGYTEDTQWFRTARLYPDIPSGITPSIRLEGWRLPAAAETTAEYPDIDIKHEWLLVVGTAAEIMRKDDPNYDRYQQMEASYMLPLAASARTI